MQFIDIDTLPCDHDKHSLLAPWLQKCDSFLEFRYQARFANTKCLRDFIAYIGEALGITDKQTSRIILITDELNNNAIEHGSVCSSINKMRVRYYTRHHASYLQIEVEDAGDGNSPKTALDMETMRAHKLKRGYGNHDSIRGRGLFLITVQIAERLYFKNATSGGLIVGVHVKKEE